MSKQTAVIIILAVLLVAAAAYIVTSHYISSQHQKQFTLTQQGAVVGYQKAIIDVATIASTCQIVPLVIENQTINMIAVDCLQQAR